MTTVREKTNLRQLLDHQPFTPFTGCPVEKAGLQLKAGEVAVWDYSKAHSGVVSDVGEGYPATALIVTRAVEIANAMQTGGVITPLILNEHLKEKTLAEVAEHAYTKGVGLGVNVIKATKVVRCRSYEEIVASLLRYGPCAVHLWVDAGCDKLAQDGFLETPQQTVGILPFLVVGSVWHNREVVLKATPMWGEGWGNAGYCLLSPGYVRTHLEDGYAFSCKPASKVADKPVVAVEQPPEVKATPVKEPSESEDQDNFNSLMNEDLGESFSEEALKEEVKEAPKELPKKGSRGRKSNTPG